MEKQVLIRSFGHDFLNPKGLTQEEDGKEKVRIKDVRNLNDPYPRTMKSGQSTETKKILLDDPKVVTFLDKEQKELKKIVNSFLNGEKKVLWLYYGCAGGYQRSVFTAEYMFHFLQKEFPEQFNLTVGHLTLDLCLKKIIHCRL